MMKFGFENGGKFAFFVRLRSSVAGAIREMLVEGRLKISTPENNKFPTHFHKKDFNFSQPTKNFAKIPPQIHVHFSLRLA